MISEQQIDRVRVIKSPIFSVSEASFSFPRAYFAAVNFEIAVSMPEAQREKQTE